MKGRPRQRAAPCQYCNKEFKRQEHLERHLRTHTKERPYVCGCGRMFSRQDLLRRHHRVNQCAAANGLSNPVGGQTTSPGESIANSLPLSASTTVQTPPFPIPHDGDPVQATPSRDTEHYSQGQLMGKFSVYDLNAELLQGHSPAFFSSRDATENAGINTSDLPVDFPPDLLPLEMDFLFDEADVINTHLSEVFPTTNYHALQSYDDPSVYGGVQQPPIDAVHLGEPRPPRSTEAVMTPTFHNAAASHSQQIETIKPNPPEVPDRRGLPGSLGGSDEIVPTNPWDVSKAAYERLSVEFSRHQDPSEPFTLPSRGTISRHVASWARSYHPHLPVIHLPTNNFDRRTPMLLLTIAAVGSFYGFEHANGYPMCFVAKSVVRQKLEDRRRALTSHLAKSVPRYTDTSGSTSSRTTMPSPESSYKPVDIELLQSLLILVMSMAWLDGPLAQEAMAWSSELNELTREALKCQVQHYPMSSWESWAWEEERRRTIYSAYFTLNIITICSRIPPQIPPTEITLPLPSSEAEFKASNAESWRALQLQNNFDPMSFQDCFKQLLQGIPLPRRGLPTEFGNYMLVQSLLTQIYFERQGASCLLSSSSSLPASTISLYDSALSAWQSCWDSAIESALDPSSPHGPLAFNSTAMLRLAHVNLAVDIHGHCFLSERNPAALARAFLPDRNPVPLRSDHLDQAVMHAINALRIPIRVGIAFVARGRTGHWSVQHAISNFSCALLLTHWFENMYGLVSENGMAALRHEEKCLLTMVERLIEETHLADSLGGSDAYPGRIRRASIAALRLWAETCKGMQVYEIIRAIGETLTTAADSLEVRDMG